MFFLDPTNCPKIAWWASVIAKDRYKYSLRSAWYEIFYFALFCSLVFSTWQSDYKYIQGVFDRLIMEACLNGQYPLSTTC